MLSLHSLDIEGPQSCSLSACKQTCPLHTTHIHTHTHTRTHAHTHTHNHTHFLSLAHTQMGMHPLVLKSRSVMATRGAWTCAGCRQVVLSWRCVSGWQSWSTS